AGPDAGNLWQSVDGGARVAVDWHSDCQTEGVTHRGPTLLHRNRCQRRCDRVAYRIDPVTRRAEVTIDDDSAVGIHLDTDPVQAQAVGVRAAAGSEEHRIGGEHHLG